MNKKNIILTSSAGLVLASLLAGSFAFADSSTGAVENTLLNKNVKQNMHTGRGEKREIPVFIKNLPEATQEKLKTLQETHREEVKAIFDTYKDSEKTDAIQEEIDAKMEVLQTKHKAELTTLLNGVDGAEDFIAKMGEGPKGMGRGHFEGRGMGEKREIPVFIKNLPEATQEKLKTLQETHREEVKAIFDTYKDSEKTDAIQEEIDAKMEVLQTKHKAELTTLLNGVDGAEDFIAKMGEGPKGMGRGPRNMDGEHFGKAQNQADDSAE